MKKSKKKKDEKTGKCCNTLPQFWIQILLMSNHAVRLILKPKTLQIYEKKLVIP